MDRWYLGLDPSSIKDGTYPEFFRGQQADFAVACRWEACERAVEPPAQVAAVRRLEGIRYEVIARVVAVGDEGWLFDGGPLIGCRGRPPAGVEVGHWVTGQAELSLHPHPDPDWATEGSPVVRTWFIERIFHRTEPGTDLTGMPALSGIEGLFGEPEEPGFEELAFTDAWRDDEGRAEYLLECVLVADDAQSPNPP